MRPLRNLALCLMPIFAVSAFSAETTVSALTCGDFRPTPEALERFPDLVGACESVVERDGELFGLFRAVVRRATNRSVTLFLPATDRTFVVEPGPDSRVLIGGRKVRPRDLTRGEEIRIYLSASTFSRPDIDEIVLVTESDLIVTHPVMPVRAMPTTASPWPALGLVSLIVLGAGVVLRRRRLSLVEVVR